MENDKNMVTLERIQSEHKRYLRRYPFVKHERFFGLTFSERVILNRYGYWFEALALGLIEAYTDKQKLFLEVVRGQRVPITDFERAWFKYARAEQDSGRLYEEAFKMQTSMQVSGKKYEDIEKAYKIAAEAGSVKANVWLNEHKISYIKPNSLWTRPEGASGGQVNNRHTDEINSRS